jgi:hypothetical protein
MYNLDYFRELSMSDFMDRMGFDKSGHRFICPLCGQGESGDNPGFCIIGNDRAFYCHACVRGGDIFKLIQEWKGYSFGEALRELAGIYGISEEKTDLKPVTYQVFDQVRTFYKIEDALKWERKILDESHKECIRKVRVYIAILNGHDIIPDDHWLCKCLRPSFTNPTPWQLLTIIKYLGG